ncbi:type IV pilus biogenesis protein PilM [Neisseria lisongii]|uniref:Pilus assembly protein PilM n=1 Tax=Neisseria lisongii TaxID=2912188 RepID=A0AAW5APY5_9NEIS|nr:pilus assembly protein PilM [Neisseria lisongii]MCF7530496.1 pilus assembly protein PilM [Neisseria lisongii]
MRLSAPFKKLFPFLRRPSDTGFNTAAGIDIEQNAVKAVLLSGSRLEHICVEHYLIVPLAEDAVKGDKIQDYEQLVTYLQQIRPTLGACRRIAAALPDSLTATEELHCPPDTSVAEIETLIESGLLPSAAAESVRYDYHISAAPEAQHIVAVSAKQDDIELRAELFEQAGLALSVLDTDLLAQHHAFLFWLNLHAPELLAEKTVFVGIYSTQTYVLIVQHGRILYRQETQSGAAMPSENDISETFNIQTAYTIQRALQFYASTQDTEPPSAIRHIFLTGSATQNPDLAATVSRICGISAQTLHPVAHAKFGSTLNSAQLQHDAPELTIAFGLALRGLHHD